MLKVKKFNPRLPLPKKIEKIHKDLKKYSRKKKYNFRNYIYNKIQIIARMNFISVYTGPCCIA